MKKQSHVRNRTRKENIGGKQQSRVRTEKTLKDIVAKEQPKSRSRNVVAVLVTLGVLLFLIVIGSAQAMSQGTGWPLPKLQLLAHDQQLMRQSQALHRPKPVPHAPPVQAPPVLHAGIASIHQGPFSSTQFTVRNFWQGPVGSNWELVYAGAQGNANGSVGPGALRLYTEVANANGGFDLHYLGTYIVPNSDSALTITAANGHTLQLLTDAGRKLTFNLQDNQYG